MSKSPKKRRERTERRRKEREARKRQARQKGPPESLRNAVATALRCKFAVDEMPVWREKDNDGVRVPAGFPPPEAVFFRDGSILVGMRTAPAPDGVFCTLFPDAEAFMVEVFRYDMMDDVLIFGVGVLPIPAISGGRHYDIRRVYRVQGISQTGTERWREVLVSPNDPSFDGVDKTRESLSLNTQAWDDMISAIGNAWRYQVAGAIESGILNPESLPAQTDQDVRDWFHDFLGNLEPEEPKANSREELGRQVISGLRQAGRQVTETPSFEALMRRIEKHVEGNIARGDGVPALVSCAHDDDAVEVGERLVAKFGEKVLVVAGDGTGLAALSGDAGNFLFDADRIVRSRKYAVIVESIPITAMGNRAPIDAPVSQQFVVA